MCVGCEVLIMSTFHNDGNTLGPPLNRHIISVDKYSVMNIMSIAGEVCPVTQT